MLQFTLADPQRHDLLTVFPLTSEEPTDLDYRLLPEAIADGTLSITELGDGRVPELWVENAGAADVLILEGEGLIGAKQNRTTGRSLIVESKTRVRIPVSCMEQGRWRAVGLKFAAAADHAPANVRRHARRAESRQAARGPAAGDRGVASAAETGAPGPAATLAEAQGGVWSEIAAYAGKLGARSPTGALDAVYEARRIEIGEWAEQFPRVEGQVGMLAFLGPEPLALDLVGSTGLYARVHDARLRGYVLDALAARAGDLRPAHVRLETAAPFIERVRRAPRVTASTVGRGTYRVLGDGVIGGELEDGGRTVHLCAFPADE